MAHVPDVLFVCGHNAGRSQMAAALLHHHARGRVHVRSAGSAPADAVNPAVVEVMSELGIDLSQALPKPLTDDVIQAAEVVITMGCGDACPVYIGKRYLDWVLEDPPVRQSRRSARFATRSSVTSKASSQSSSLHTSAANGEEPASRGRPVE